MCVRADDRLFSGDRAQASTAHCVDVNGQGGVASGRHRVGDRLPMGARGIDGLLASGSLRAFDAWALPSFVSVEPRTGAPVSTPETCITHPGCYP